MPAAFEQKWVKNLHPNNVKSSQSKMDLAEQVMKDIERFKKQAKADRLVMIWAASTEVYIEPQPVHDTLETFEEGLKNNSPDISPSMIYAYAALKLGVPFANGAPHITVDIPALSNLALKKKVPICGKDFKSGQTFMKTLLAPGIKAKMLGLTGWFSTNILGNRDGEVLDDPDNFKSKEVTKSSVLEHIIQPDLYPELYKGYYHKVRIEYYPPRGDNKESWDNIDIFGWLGYPMQIKVNCLFRDSILAAPMALDLVLFMDLAQRTPALAKMGIQEWLSFYFKSPMCAASLYPEHDVFIQLMKLKNTLRHLRGEELITHLGLEYYD
jgi:myo-inositol-1-phosphate synthase